MFTTLLLTVLSPAVHAPVYPAASDVRTGVTYGPTGADYTGTYTAGGLTTGQAAMLTAVFNQLPAAGAAISSYAGGAVASVTGSVGSVTSPVSLTTAYDRAKTAAQPSDVAVTVSGGFTTQAAAELSALFSTVRISPSNPSEYVFTVDALAAAPTGTVPDNVARLVVDSAGRVTTSNPAVTVEVVDQSVTVSNG